jgi:hypothetical protein
MAGKRQCARSARDLLSVCTTANAGFLDFFFKKNQKNIRGVQGFCSLSAQPPTQVSSSYSTDTLIVLKKKSSFFSVVFGSVRDLLSVCTTANAGVLT